MADKMCKFSSKGIDKEEFEKYSLLVGKPKYICKKCGRAARDSDNLCDPKKIKKMEAKKENEKD